jgi:hypothetical protein
MEEEKMMRSKMILLLIISLLTPAISFADETTEPKIEKKTTELRLEVIKAKLSGKGNLLDIQFRIRGEIGNPILSMKYARNTYVIEESNGEKFYARRFARIGALGQKHLDEGPISFVTMNNPGGKIKKGSRITFVIGELRQEHIIVEE